MRMPDDELRWVAYCRLVLPPIRANTPYLVRVVSEISPVEIQLM